MNIFKLLFLLLFLQSCIQRETKRKAETIKEYAIEKGIYEKQLIYFSNEFHNQVSLPNIKLYDSIGKPLQVGNCMNAIDNIILNISSDSFKYIYTNDVLFDNYIDSLNIIDVDDLKNPIRNKKYKYYMCYFWNYGLELFSDKKSASAIFRIMKNASQIANSKKVKLIYIHS